MKKVFTYLTAALLAFVGIGSANAQDVPAGETDITTLSWVQKRQGCASDFNTDAGTVYGHDAKGSDLSYVDISDYGTIKLYGTAGQQARIFINVEEYGQDTNKGTYFVTLNEDGVATFDCSQLLTTQPGLQYIHLNGVKAYAWDTKLNLSMITVSGSAIDFPEEFVFPAGETDINTLPWVQKDQNKVNNLGVMTGDPIWGTDSGEGTVSYVDLADYGYIKVYGPADQTVRAFINRKESESYQFYITIDKTDASGNSYGELDLSQVYATGVKFVHLNGFKASSYGQSAQIDHIAAYGDAPNIFELPDDEFYFNDLTLVGSICDNNIGKKLEGGNVIYGSQSDGNHYRDVSAFKTLRIYGTENAAIRIFVNRDGKEDVTDGKTEQKLTIDSKGYVDMDVASVMEATGKNYCRVSSFKVAYNGQTPKIYAITVKDAIRNVPEMGLASFSCVSNVNVPDGVAVYTAKIDGTDVVLSKVETDVIPANTGVILCSETAGEKTFTLTQATPTADFSENDLVATSVTANTLTSGTCYALSSSKAEFAKVKEGTNISSNKAYLKVAAASAAKLRVVFQGDEATGISEATETVGASNGQCYNLAGQQVGAGYKGIVVKNGKKAVVK